MDAIRGRLGTAIEWLLAAGVLAAAAAAGSLVVRGLSTVTDAPAVAVETAAPALMPAIITGRAVAVPILVLLDGKEVRLGDSERRIAALLGRSAETGAQQVDRRGVRELITRFYEYAGTRFVLVFERAGAQADTTVAAIFVQ
jgi:hypothetical protein